jgi:hypothetical protein
MCTQPGDIIRDDSEACPVLGAEINMHAPAIDP